MGARQYRQPISTNFIRHIAIGCYSIRTDKDRVNIAVTHKMRGHIIGNQR